MVKLISAILSLTMLFGAGAAPNSISTVAANVPVMVGAQQAVYEKYNCSTKKKLQYTGLTWTIDRASGLSEQKTAYRSYTVNKDTGVVTLIEPYLHGETVPKYSYYLFYGLDTGTYRDPADNRISGRYLDSYTCIVGSYEYPLGGQILNIKPQTAYADEYTKEGFVENVTVINNSLPVNGRHSDGYWYVFKNLVED